MAASIYRAAKTFNFPQFLKYAERCIQVQFSGYSKDVTAKPLEYAVEAVLLARTWGLPSILKRAFYELVRKDPEDDEENDSDTDDKKSGSETGDKESDDEVDFVAMKVEGSVAGVKVERDASSDDDIVDEAYQRDYGVRKGLIRLNPADLVRLLTAQKRLTTSWHQAFSLQKPECSQNKTRCAINIVRAHWDTPRSSGILTKYERDPIRGIRVLSNIDWKSKGHCESCSAAILSRLKAQEKHIWRQLDNWFGLRDD